MLNDDFVQTHKNNNRESSPDPVLRQKHPDSNGTENRSSNTDNDFNYPNSPKPTRVIVPTVAEQHQQQQKQQQAQHASVHSSSYQTHHTHKRRRRVSSIIHLLPPPQNRLAFIHAVKIAWSIQYKNIHKKTKRKSHFHSQYSDYKKKKKISTHYAMNSGDIGMIVKNKLDFPPITAEALSELSVSQLYKSLQIRHDLLLDPHLTFRPNVTPEKTKESDSYWRRLDHLIKISRCATDEDRCQLIYLVRNLLTELSLILISLISPFPSHPTTSFVWNWPPHVTESAIMAVLDPDLVHQQLLQDCLNVDFKFSFLHSILNPLCPEQAEKIQRQVNDGEYAKALELSFYTLENIKLDCANKALHYFRPYLIETGTSVEWKIFLKQMDNGEVDISSVSDWMSCTWNRLGLDTKFIQVFRTGLVNLMTDDSDIIAALQLSTSVFPITFCYDEKRLKHHMRHEFQNIIVIGLLLMPYRLMAGKNAKESDLNQLKSTYSKLLKDASVNSGRVSCFHLAIHACNMAKQLNPQQQTTKDDIIEQAKYWSNWMNQNLRNTSPVYQIMYHRVRALILCTMAQGPLLDRTAHATIGLEQEIAKLSEKLTLLADYNLRTFGSLYTYLIPSIQYKEFK